MTDKEINEQQESAEAVDETQSGGFEAEQREAENVQDEPANDAEDRPENDSDNELEVEFEEDDRPEYDEDIDQAAARVLGEGGSGEDAEGEEEYDDQQADDQQSEQFSDDTFPEDFEATLESVIEAILFASDEPLSESRLSSIAEAGGAKQVRECVESLNNQYEMSGRAFRIEQIAGGYQMMTLGPYNYWLRKMMRVRTDNKLTQAAMETLAIVAYKQPIIRADIEAIRGVASGEMIRSLMYKGLVKIVGRAEVIGRPMLYGTTKKFLDVFGLNSLKDLPSVEELSKPKDQ